MIVRMHQCAWFVLSVNLILHVSVLTLLSYIVVFKVRVLVFVIQDERLFIGSE